MTKAKKRKPKDILKKLWEATERISKKDNPSAILKDSYFKNYPWKVRRVI